MPAARLRKVNEAVREVVSTHIAEDLKDPRVGFVTVTSVDTSPDLRHAHVYVTVLGDETVRAEAMAGLNSAAGYLQTAIGRELRMKNTPNLDFRYDNSTDEGFRIADLIRENQREEEQR